MICVVLVSSLFGLLLPFVLERMKFDPATASAPLITSVADIAGIVIYFTIATVILGLPSPG
jgi:magnesium transporter